MNKRLASGVEWIASVEEFVTQEKQKRVEFVVVLGGSTHGLPAWTFVAMFIEFLSWEISLGSPIYMHDR